MSDFEFESEFKDSVSKSAMAAARATEALTRDLDGLGKAEFKAAKGGLALARSHLSVARAAERAEKAQRELNRTGIFGGDRRKATANLKTAQASLRLARAQQTLLAAKVGAGSAKKAPGVSKGPLLAAAGAAAILATSLATVRVGAAAVGKSIDFTEQVGSMAVFNESMRFSFKTLTGDGEAAFQKTRQLSLLLGEDLQTTGERMRGLLAQKFTLSQSEGLLKMLADLRLVGVEGEKADRVLMALTQIKSKGRLQAEEMLQLAEAGISLETVYGELGKKLGKTRTELEKLQKAGKVTSQDALDAVQSASLVLVNKTKAGDAGAEFIETTLSGMQKQFRSTKSIVLSDIADRATPAFKALGPIVKDVSGALVNPALVEKLGKTFDVIGAALGRVGPKAGKDLAFGLDIAADAFDRIVRLGTAFTEGFIAGVEPFLEQLGTEGVAGVDNLEGSFSLFGSTAGATIGALTISLNNLVASLDRIGAATDEVLEFFSIDTHSAGVAVGSAFIDGMVSAMKAGALFVSGNAGAAADELASGASKALGIKSPSRVGMHIGAMFDRGVALGIDRNGFSAGAASRLGAGIESGIRIPARQGTFAGSPAHRAMTNSNNRNVEARFQQTNHFSGMGNLEAGATAKASLLNLSALAKAKISIGV